MTVQEKIDFLFECKRYFDNANPLRRTGFCWVLAYFTSYDQSDFPELFVDYKVTGKFTEYDIYRFRGYWFPLDDEGCKKRIDICNELIIKLKHIQDNICLPS